MDTPSFIGGFILAIIIYKLYLQKKKPDLKEKVIGTLATFKTNQQGDIFFIESISYDVDVCHVRHIDSGLSRWYRIPGAGSGQRKLIANESYILDFGSIGVPMFLILRN